MSLNKKELERYGRQMILPEIGEAGQLRLKAAKVLVVGTGGLGSPGLIYLAAAGVGTIGVIDADKVDLSNLHRQVLHTTKDLKKAKVVSAKEKLKALNPHIKVVTYKERFSEKNAAKLIKEYDLIVDGTDNFATRYLINDACVLAGKPFVFGGIFRFEGQVSVFSLSDGPCYRCFLPEPPKADEVPSCAEAGVLGILPGIIGLLQANEAVKLICKMGEPLKGRLLIFDALATEFREVRFKKDPQCAVCGPNATIKKVEEAALPVACVLRPEAVPEVTVQELKKLLDKKPKDFMLIDVREKPEWDAKHIDGAVLMPMSTLQESYQKLPKNKRICMHCGGGGRSSRAVQFLQSKGYKKVFNIKGGIRAWAEKNPTVVKN